MSRIEKQVDVDVPVAVAYNQWTKFESYPVFMGSVDRVEQRDEDLLHFHASLNGVDRSWLAKIEKQEPNREVSWVSVEGVKNQGNIQFEPLGEHRTKIIFQVEYEPDDQKERLGDMLGVFDRQVMEDLNRFKRFIEEKHHNNGALGIPPRRN